MIPRDDYCELDGRNDKRFRNSGIPEFWNLPDLRLVVERAAGYGCSGHDSLVVRKRFFDVGVGGIRFRNVFIRIQNGFRSGNALGQWLVERIIQSVNLFDHSRKNGQRRQGRLRPDASGGGCGWAGFQKILTPLFNCGVQFLLEEDLLAIGRFRRNLGLGQLFRTTPHGRSRRWRIPEGSECAAAAVIRRRSRYGLRSGRSENHSVKNLSDESGSGLRMRRAHGRILVERERISAPPVLQILTIRLKSAIISFNSIQLDSIQLNSI